MANTYTKLRSGDWGIRLDSPAQPGDVVVVEKKSGERKTEVVGRILRTGDDYCLATIESGAPRRNRSSRHEPSLDRGSSLRSVERTYRRRYGWDGVRGSASYYSSGMYDEES